MKKIISFLSVLSFFLSALFAVDLVPEEKITYSFKPEQVQNLEVNFSAGKLSVQEAFTSDITVTITKDYDAPSPTAKIDKGTLVIKTKLLSSYKKQVSILIEIPFGKKLEDIKLTSVSANIFLKNLNAKIITTTTASGMTQVEKCNISSHLKIGAASGKVSVSGIKGNNVTISTVNGIIDLEDLSAKLCRTETANGRISCKKIKTDGFEAQTMNGSIEYQFDKMIENDSWVKTTSGTIDLVFPKGKGYKAIVTTQSGEFIDKNTNITGVQCEDLESRYKNGNVEIKINTKSGNINIDSE
ncbi:MAG: DUF4097 domain-containing protein [Treponema sp.]|nr:DUF4097 domain-containing protein [Treponema sp.]